MKKIIIIIIYIFSINYVFSQWENLNTEIDDNLTGVVFLQENGLLSAENGLYYTLNGNDANPTWDRFTITDNTNASQIYENTKFYSCYSKSDNTTNSGTVFACGQNLSNGKAIIMKIELPSLAYNISSVYYSNGPLKDIDFRPNNVEERYYAVGENGLIVWFDESGIAIKINTNTTEDFNSIDFAYNSQSAGIGSNGKFFIFNTTNNSIEIKETPNINHIDLLYEYTTYSVGTNYMKYSTGNIYLYDNYDFGSLNPNKMLSYNGYYSKHLVGTDHGIFTSDSDKTFLEWQSGSQNYNIKNFWRYENNSNLIYACGDNGVLLKTNNSGGIPVPYINIDFGGSCSTNPTLSAMSGTSNSCQWFVDNNLVHTGCGNFAYNFGQIGEYEIKLIGTNIDGEIPEKIKNIHIVSPPIIDKDVTIEDTILCKEEFLNITILDTEPNVAYTLRKEGNNEKYGTSIVSQGGNVAFTSNLITESGNYYLTAKNTLINSPYYSNCDRSFTDRYDIIVEKTEADFHVSRINANIGEDISFYETTTDAQNFEWTFENSSIITGNEANPIVSFNTIGNTNINLKTWSNEGCFDEITLPGANIEDSFDESYDKSWSIKYLSGNPQYYDIYHSDISHMTKTNNGFLVGGFWRESTFESNFGIDFNLDGLGAYLSKHDNNGMLKWIIYSKSSSYWSGEIYDSAIDLNENIYAVGSITNLSDNTDTNYDFISSGNLVKLSNEGNLIWDLRVQNSWFKSVSIDKNDNLITMVRSIDDDNYNHLIFLDELNIGQIGIDSVDNRPQNTIVKFSPDGDLIWHASIYIYQNNEQYSSKYNTTLDNQNNIYMTINQDGSRDINFYSANSTTPNLNIPHSSYYNLTSGSYLVKYNSDGIIQRRQRLHYTRLNGENSFGIGQIYDIKSDAQGYIYILGENYDSNEYLFTFDNADGTNFTSNLLGDYFLLKVSPDGQAEWVVGNNTGTNTHKNNGKIYINDLDQKVYLLQKFTNSNVENELITLNFDNLNFDFNSTDLVITEFDFNGNLLSASVSPENIDTFSTEIKSFFKIKENNFLYSMTEDRNVAEYRGIGVISNISLNSSDVITYSPTLSSINTLNPLDFKVQPNPSNGNYQIEFKKNQKEIKINVFDVLGNKIQTEKAFDIEKYNLVINAVNGLYFIKIANNLNETNTLKLIKQ